MPPPEEAGQAMSNTSNSSWTLDALAEQITHLQQVVATTDRREVGPAQAHKTIVAFWEQIERTPDGCWLWRGPDKARIWWGTSSYHIDPKHLAWVLSTGRAFPDVLRFTLMPTCQVKACLNPAHRLQVISLEHVGQWYWQPKEGIGADDWQEIGYRFTQEVEAGSLPSLLYDGKPVVQSEVFDAWLHTTGRHLIEAFSRKYRAGRSRAVSRAKKAAQTTATPARARWGASWWQAFGLTADDVRTQVNRFQQIASALSETPLDQETARRSVERFYSRIAPRQGGCWAWNWPEPQFRMFKYGPWIGPRDLAWWLTTGTSFGGRLGASVASHNGGSWCINPAHSDVQFDTINAAQFLVRLQQPPTAPAPATPDDQDAPVQTMRHLLHQAVEQGTLPYRIDERSLGIKLWKSDVLEWWRPRDAQRDAHFT
jgi:hypothetical protein